MIRKEFSFIFIFIILISFSNAFSASDGLCGCNSCYDCMTALNSKNCNIVKLTQDINAYAGSSCIQNGFSGKTLDCDGFSIKGDPDVISYGNTYSSLVGIYMTAKKNSIIKNCVVNYFLWGIKYENIGENNLMENVKLEDNSYGLFISGIGQKIKDVSACNNKIRDIDSTKEVIVENSACDISKGVSCSRTCSMQPLQAVNQTQENNTADKPSNNLAEECKESCATNNLECGEQNICNKTISCGTCGEEKTCSNGKCIARETPAKNENKSNLGNIIISIIIIAFLVLVVLILRSRAKKYE